MRHESRVLMWWCAAAALMVVLATPQEARAHTVTVDPGDYSGEWRIGSTYLTGVQSVDLPTGASLIRVGNFGSFGVTVDASGSVTVDNGTSGVGGLGSLTFNTVDVVVDPADFDGEWRVSRGEPAAYVSGVGTATFVPGVTFGVGAGGASTFFVVADAAGNVTVNNGVSAVGGLGTLTFNTVDVVVDPGAYDGQWRMSRGEPASDTSGVATATLVPGIRFGLVVGAQGTIFVSADAAGNMTVENGVSGVGGLGTITLNTVDVLVDPGDFTGQWTVSRGEPGQFLSGSATATLVPGARWQFNIAGGGVFVRVDLAGNVTVENGISGQGGVQSLTFLTSDITFDPGAYTGGYRVSLVNPADVSGVQTLALVRGVRYLFDPPGPSNGQFFTVLEPCDISPSVFTAGSDTITAACGCTDGDLDGICDVDDGCPNDPDNDADGDGVCGDVDQCSGDDATGDSDGDGICDDTDLCAGDNATGDTDNDGICNDNDQCSGNDQSGDTDGDGICDSDDLCQGDDASGNVDGDGFCDDVDLCTGDDLSGDSDGDGVCDDSDLCPLDADNDDDGDGVCGNLDICVGDDATGDSDADSVCDDLDLCTGNDVTGDQDADGVCDDIDNCPVDANADQADGDGDAVGDVCEADTDADGIIDDVDNCVDVVNVDQADLDGDGAGDVCDDDDDDDGVLDVDDNCPTYANADQADLDLDGFGDVCDGDDDADGVADDVDLCPGTPLSSVFDDNGCSGPQFIELKCGAPSDYYFRGRYVACVVRTSKVAQRRGLITRRQRAVIIRQAIRRTWYRPRNRRCWWR